MNKQSFKAAVSLIAAILVHAVPLGYAHAQADKNTFQRQVELFQSICVAEMPSYEDSIMIAETTFGYSKRQKHRGGAYLYSETEPFDLYIRVDGECHVDGRNTRFSRAEANTARSSLRTQGFATRSSLVAPDDGTGSFKSFDVISFETREYMFRISYDSGRKTSSISTLNR